MKYLTHVFLSIRDLVVVYFIGFLYLLKQFLFRMLFVSQGMKSNASMLKYKKSVALITGGSGGIGYELISKLIDMDVHVIIGVFEIEKIKKISSLYPSVEVYKLDLSDMDSVTNLASLIERKHKHIDILIHCAGVMFDKKLTKHGSDYQFTVNYLGPSLLTLKILPSLLKSSKVPKLIFISSCEHFAAGEDHLNLMPNFKDGNSNTHSVHAMYAWSKLCLILFAYALHRRLKRRHRRHRPMEVVCVHPGIVDTDLYKNVWWAFSILRKIFFITPEQSAENVMTAMFSCSDSCCYWSDGFFTKSSHVSYDASVQEQLWEKMLQFLAPWIDPKKVV